MILYHAWLEDTPTFLSLLRTNKSLHRIGKDLLYTDVHIGRRGFSRAWLTTFATNSFASRNIRSLTISKMSSFASIDHTCLVQFLQTLSALGKLTTYSFNNISLLTTFTYKHKCAWDQDYDLTNPDCAALDLAMMECVIRETLLALPSSVVNIELMIDDVQQPWQFASLCPIIGSLLPRLKTLQLRLPRVCDEILNAMRASCSSSSEPTQSKLQFAAIWLNGETAPCCHRIGDQEVCGNYFRGTRHRFVSPDIQPPLGRHGFLHAALLAQSVRDVYEQDRFPYLERFSVLQETHPVNKSGNTNHWEIREIVSNTTATVLHKRFGPEETSNAWGTYTGGESDFDHVALEQFSRVVEPGVWSNAANGTRRPPGAIDTALALKNEEVFELVDGLDYLFEYPYDIV